MKIATTIAEVRAQVREWKQQGLTVGLVPTMAICMKDTPVWSKRPCSSATAR